MDGLCVFCVTGLECLNKIFTRKYCNDQRNREWEKDIGHFPIRTGHEGSKRE
jgi:hypothetical protein